MKSAWLVLLSFGVLGCDGDEVAKNQIIPRLKPLPSCEAAISHFREVALARMNKQLDEALLEYREGRRCTGWGWGSGEDDASPTAGGGSGAGSGGGGPTTGTGTNNQVSGVDEADFIKNDGQYLYLAQNGVLRIVDSWPADQTHTVSTTDLEGEPKQLFIDGDRALIYVSIGSDGSRAECTYGYDCDFTGDGTLTRALVYDISDRAAPRLERIVALPGSLIAGRKIGHAVHTVVATNPDPYNQLPTFPLNTAWCDFDGAKPPLPFVAMAQYQIEQLREKNREIIEDTDISAILPIVVDSAYETDDSACTSMYASEMTDGASFITLASVDMLANEPVASSTIISAPGAIYASADSLYLAVPHQSDVEDYEWASVSTIHKFAIGDRPEATSYIGSGTVTGRPLNQFAMDEHEGFLRIATSNGHPPDPRVESRLTVLAEENNELVTVGMVDHIAPTEDIRAVRFDGNRAFVVTFKKTDPLFTFDLSNPRDPKLRGELEIPGFSTYMHMLDETHLLTIGYDADDHGDFAFFDGVILQIFDVSIPTAPSLMHRHTIGTRGSSSEALTNHLAFTWYPEKSLLAVPMTICEGGGDGSFGTMTFNGLMVFDVSLAGGIAEHGRVAHPVGDEVTCSNWWSQASSSVKRSLFLDTWVYSVSEEHLKVNAIESLGTDLKTVPLR